MDHSKRFVMQRQLMNKEVQYKETCQSKGKGLKLQDEFNRSIIDVLET